MSGAMRKMGVYLGLLEDSDRYDEEFYDRDGQDGQDTEATGRQAAPVAHLAERRRPTGPGGSTAAATIPAQGPTVAELSRITTLHPTTYNEARVIGENFRDGIPVIMNLSEINDGDAKRKPVPRSVSSDTSMVDSGMRLASCFDTMLPSVGWHTVTCAPGGP